MKRSIVLFQLGLLVFFSQVWAQTPRVVDIPTRPGVTQRMVVLGSEKPKAAVVLFAGGHGCGDRDVGSNATFPTQGQGEKVPDNFRGVTA